MSSSNDLAARLSVTDVEGLHRVCGAEDPRRRGDIVFVHGLGGGARSTWECGIEGKSDHFFWPAELGKDLPDCGVWTLGYEAGIVPWFGADGMPIEDRAINLAHKMTTRGLGDRPLIFIAHSMGGLMVKEIVVQSITAGDPDWSALVSNIAGIVFCGTPHRGSDVASMATKLAAILRTQDHIRDMAAGVRHLDRLHTRFVEWQGNAKVPVEAYAERLGMTRQSIWLRWLTKVLIVPPGSADPQIKGCRCIPCNNHHTGLVKPCNREHDVYSGVRKFIATCLASPQHKPLGMSAPVQSVVNLARNSIHQLPLIPRGFVGRETDLKMLRAINPSEGAVLTGLRGMGGIGKTALALVLAHEWSARFPDAQLFLDGQGTRQEPPPPTAADLMAQIIQTFHPTEKLPNDEVSLKLIYQELLRRRKVLILLDNARDASQTSPLIPPAGCALIVTSRQSFMLGINKPHSVGKLPDKEAALLLREYHSSLGNADATELIKLCAGLPLALRLAGAHLALDASERGGVPDVASYIRALGSGRLKHLDADAEDAGEIAISETLRLSEDQLNPGSRDAWRNLSVFTASFEAIAGSAIAGADEEMLRVFVRRSLLECEGAERYKLHDISADYARARLTDVALTGLRLSHAKHYTKVGVEADSLYLRGDVVRGLALFDRERIQVEAAFAWLAARQDATAATVLLALIDAVIFCSSVRLHPRQSIAWHTAQLVASRIAGDPKSQSRALCTLGVSHDALGDARKAIEFYEQALVIAREMNDRRAEGSVLGNLGISYQALGEMHKAIAFHEQALEIAREIGDRRAEAQDLGNLGNAYNTTGDPRKAIAFLEPALVIAREIGNRYGEGYVLGSLGVAHQTLGYARKAIDFLQEALVVIREIGDRRGEGRALGNLAIAYASLGDRLKAVDVFDERLTIAREMGDRRGEGHALWNSANELAKIGNRSEAFARARAALRILEEIESPYAAHVRTQMLKWEAL